MNENEETTEDKWWNKVLGKRAKLSLRTQGNEHTGENVNCLFWNRKSQVLTGRAEIGEDKELVIESLVRVGVPDSEEQFGESAWGQRARNPDCGQQRKWLVGHVKERTVGKGRLEK